jgi:hypothetical protein
MKLLVAAVAAVAWSAVSQAVTLPSPPTDPDSRCGPQHASVDLSRCIESALPAKETTRLGREQKPSGPLHREKSRQSTLEWRREAADGLTHDATIALRRFCRHILNTPATAECARSGSPSQIVSHALARRRRPKQQANWLPLDVTSNGLRDGAKKGALVDPRK